MPAGEARAERPRRAAPALRLPGRPVGSLGDGARRGRGKALGADLIEVHIVFSHDCFGPDTSSSLTPAQLTQLVDGVRFVERALAHPMDKDAFAAEHAELRRTFGKSVVAARDLAEGAVLDESALALKKPGTGIPAARYDEVLGKRLRRSVVADEQIREEDLV